MKKTMAAAKDKKPVVVDLITEELFREAYQYQEVKQQPLKKIIIQKLKCTRSTLFDLFPIASWLPTYSLKSALAYDLIAGITVAVMHIPHGLAYAPLGKAPPVVGLYMAVFPVFVYMFLGTSRHISIGTFAVICALVGQIAIKKVTVEEVADVYGTQVYSEKDLQVGISICLMVGIWQALLGVLKLGMFTVIMSESMVAGFTTGAAIHVISYQLKNLFGVHVASFSGIFKLVYIYIDFFSKIETANVITSSISFICIITLLLFTVFLNPLIVKRCTKFRFPPPVELVVIIIGILISYFADLSGNYGVAIVANIPRGFPMPTAPPLNIVADVILDSLMVAMVAIAINLSLAKIFAKKDDYSISSNQELIAYGFANIISSFFQCLPSSASLSRSSVQHSIGGKTQLASLFSVTFIILLLLFAGPIFEPVPYCVLSSIVVVTLKGLLFQVCDVPRIWRRSYWDGIVWVGTFLAVIILNLEWGLGIGVLFSVASLLFSSQTFQMNIIGRVPKTNIYLDLAHYGSAQPVPNIIILQMVGILDFANTISFESRILKEYQTFSEAVAQAPANVILHMGSVTKIDPAGVSALLHVNKSFEKMNCKMYLSDCNVSVYKTLEVCHFFSGFPRDRVTASVSDAVEYLSSVT